jgi:hypothetical protein
MKRGSGAAGQRGSGAAGQRGSGAAGQRGSAEKLVDVAEEECRRCRSIDPNLTRLARCPAASIPSQIIVDLPPTHIQVVLQHLVPLGLEKPLGEMLSQRSFNHLVLLQQLERLVQVAG